VAMCVNDIITTGARPLFFLDYFGCGKLDVGTAEQVISGIAEGCRQASCALLGGETAELPGMYAPGEYDLAGFAVGVVARKKVLGPARVRVGDTVIGVASSGLHSNGFSLARRVLLEHAALSFDQHLPELAGKLGDTLITPTKIYVAAVRALLEAIGDAVHALCHVTGGGVPGNLPRIMPNGTAARVLEPPSQPIFDLIAKRGPVDRAELRRTFNCGVGLIALVDSASAESALRAFQSAGERAFVMGKVEAASEDEPARVIYDGD